MFLVKKSNHIDKNRCNVYDDMITIIIFIGTTTLSRRTIQNRRRLIHTLQRFLKMNYKTINRFDLFQGKSSTKVNPTNENTFYTHCDCTEIVRLCVLQFRSFIHFFGVSCGRGSGGKHCGISYSGIYIHNTAAQRYNYFDANEYSSISSYRRLSKSVNKRLPVLFLSISFSLFLFIYYFIFLFCFQLIWQHDNR